MNDRFKKSIYSLNILSELKKSGTLNPITARALLSAHLKESPGEDYAKLQGVIALSQMFTSPFDKPDAAVNGPIGIAQSENNHVIGIFPEEAHVLIAGQTGMGKTTLLRLIFAQALERGLQIWCFPRARDLRSLLTVDKKILVVTFDGQVKINPLNPGNLSTEDYCNIFSDIFIQSQNLFDGTKNFLIETLSTLYRIHKANKTYPSLHDLYFYIKALKHPAFSRTARYQESALNRLGGMIYGSLGKVFDCSQGHEDSLTDLNCIFEIGNISREQQVFIVNLLLTKLFHHRLATQ